MPEKLSAYIVRLRHESADITGRIAVRAESLERAGPVAIAQAIDISYPESVAADWAVIEVLG